MNLYERTHTFICETCNHGRPIPMSEYRHHQDHHAGTCVCQQAEHRMQPAWLRADLRKDMTVR